MIKKITQKYYTRFSILFWACMYLFWLWFNSNAMPDLRTNLLFTLVDFIFFAGLSVITARVLLPNFFYRKKYLLFFVWYIALLTCGTTLMLQANFLMLEPYRSASANAGFWSQYTDLAGSYMLCFFLTATTTSFKLAADWYRGQQTIAQLSGEKVKAELEFLNMQINPHSFFNILNTIYFLVDIDKEKAKKTISGFADLFRYQLYECRGEKVNLKKEIDFLRTYVELQQSRYDEDYTFTFLAETSAPQADIAPFLFLPLIENAFKHVSNHVDQPNTIDIQISAAAGKLGCCVTNSYREEAPPAENGLGLINLKRRLALLYINRHHLEIKTLGGIHKAELTIFT